MDTRCLHITGDQAIKLLRAARGKSVVTATPCECTHVQPTHLSVRSLEDLGINALLSWLNVCPQNPLQVLVGSDSQRFRITGIKDSTLSRDLPRGAFLELSRGTGDDAIDLDPSVRILIDAPPLALIHAAGHLQHMISKSRIGELDAKLHLIALASEFCGSYARDPQKPHIKRPYYDRANKCERFVGPTDLQDFLASAPMLDGLAMARNLAQYVIDESGSPMETYINHALTLPPRLAGLSMPKPLANKQLVRDKSLRKELLKHKDSLRPDLQWPEFRTLVEYLGDDDHSSHSARVEDKNRLQDYACAKYTSFFLMFDDVRSVYALNQTAMKLACTFALSGKKYEPYRLRKLIKDGDFSQRQLILVSKMLPPVMRYA